MMNAEMDKEVEIKKEAQRISKNLKYCFVINSIEIKFCYFMLGFLVTIVIFSRGELHNVLLGWGWLFVMVFYLIFRWIN